MQYFFLILVLISIFLNQRASAYQLLIADTDADRQVCSGMYGEKAKQDPFIEVLFSPSSQGTLALVIFEWTDAKYLGADPTGAENNWQQNVPYMY